MGFRTESDQAGTLQIPDSAYWGIATARRACDGAPVPRRIVQAAGVVERAVAFERERREELPVDQAEWLAAVAQELLDGMLERDIRVDLSADPDGYALVDNVREVLANRTNELMGGEPGSRQPIDPARMDLALPRDVAAALILPLARALHFVEDVLPRLSGDAREAALGEAQTLLQLPLQGLEEDFAIALLERISDIAGPSFQGTGVREQGHWGAAAQALVASSGNGLRQ